MEHKILVTGGKGKLGRELHKLIHANFRDIDELDITNKTLLLDNICQGEYNIIIHLAADTNLKRCEEDKETAFNINVNGTENIVEICKKRDIYLIYSSTDYVFNGEKGLYREDDATDPVNYYAYTKLIGEYIVNRLEKFLILRGTMKEKGKWRHPVAPTDMYESLLHHDEYAEFMVKLIERKATGIYHVGKGRYSVYEWAHQFDSDVKPKTIEEIGFPLPRDCSLNTSKLDQFLKENSNRIINIRRV